MRYCKDCKYLHEHSNDLCWKPYMFTTGEIPESHYGPQGWCAEEMRINRLYCGPEGMWYEPKEER